MAGILVEDREEAKKLVSRRLAEFDGVMRWMGRQRKYRTVEGSDMSLIGY